MKHLKFITLLIIILYAMTILPGCYGSFTLTRKVHSWNGSVGDKFVNTIVYWVLMIIPVYGACTFIDFLVLNTIEFWVGSNPLALSSEETETRIVQSGEKEFEVTIGNNEIKIKEIQGPNKGNVVCLIYDQELQAWFLQDETSAKMVVQIDDERKDIIKLFYPDGKVDEQKLMN